MEKNLEEDFPEELAEKMEELTKSVLEVDKVLQTHAQIPQTEVHAQLKPLEKAKYDLVATYALNSLFWMYLRMLGEDPKQHSVKQELERVRASMLRLKQIQDKEKAMRIDKAAAQRMVKHGLWEPKAKKRRTNNEAQK